MRPINVCLNRIGCGLRLTDEEYKAVQQYLKKEKQRRNKMDKIIGTVLIATLIVLVFIALTGCTYKVKAVPPELPQQTAGKNPTPVILLLSNEFKNLKFSASNPGAGSYHFNFGPAATISIKEIVKSKFENTTIVNVHGSGDFDFFKYVSNHPESIILRPRFTDVSMRSPLWSVVKMQIAIDINDKESIYGNGSAMIITHGTQPVQYVADKILNESMTQLMIKLNHVY